MSLILSQGTKISYATQHNQKKKNETDYIFAKTTHIHLSKPAP